MSEYREKRTVVEDVPAGSRPVVETRYDSVVSERRGMSGVAVGALVVAAVIAAVVITMLILNSQQRNRDEEQAQERARTAAAQQPAAPPPVTVNMPPPQPAIVPVPYPVPGPAQPPPLDARTEPSSASIEIDVTSRLQNDEALRSYAIDVKVIDRTATLSGHVPDETLRKRAGKLAASSNGVRTVVNDVSVSP